MMQPTRGLGEVEKRPSAARVRARRIMSRSVSLKTGAEGAAGDGGRDMAVGAGGFVGGKAV